MFNWDTLTTTEVAALKAPIYVGDDKVLVLHFLAGTHQNVTMSDGFLGSDPATGLTRWTLKIVGEGTRPEDTVLKFPDQFTVPSASQDDTGFVEVGILSFSNNSLGQFQEMKRLVLQNLTLDCNWDGQKPEYIGPQYPRSFKTYGAHLSARTGLVRKVIVRNYGAHGLVPQSVYDNSGGIEAFPLRVETTDAGQEPEPGDPRPWVVEDCEIAGFRSVYAGYNTAILAQVRGNVIGATPPADPRWVPPNSVFYTDKTRRMALVRRCQVRGPAGGLGMIGLGTAGSGGDFWSRHITFTDNILLNTGAGFNTDSGQMNELDFTNHLFLDVSVVGFLGAVDATAQFNTDYNISANSVRFYGRVAEPVYRDFNAVGLNQNQTAVSPLRVLGAQSVNYASGVTIVGAATDITMTNNWFTTRPLVGFYTPAPAATGLATFRPVWKLLGNTSPSTDVGEPYGFDPLNNYKPVRGDAVNVTLGSSNNGSENRLSGYCFDFSSSSALGEGGTFAAFTSTSSSMTGGHTALRTALSTLLNPGFNPTGTVERVVFRTANRSLTYKWLKATATGTTQADYATPLTLTEAVSIGAEEVALGVPTLSGNTLTVPVRLACQPTPGAGPTATTMPPSPAQTLRLRTTFSSGSFAETSGTTDASGVAYLTVDLTGVPADSLLRFRAWWDAPGGTANWDEYQDAWATSQWARGAPFG